MNRSAGAGRAAGAAAILLLPALGLSFLLALGTRDWFHCFAHADTPAPPPLPGLFAPGELLPVVLETLTPPFASPGLFALHLAPTLLFAVLFWRARSRRARRILLLGLALFLAMMLWLMLPLSALHDCGESGLNDIALLARLTILGSLTALLANKITCLTGAFPE